MSDAIEFKIGDVVRLQSGGCDMTIQDIGTSGGNSVNCAWHDNGGCAQASWYNPSGILLVQNQSRVGFVNEADRRAAMYAPQKPMRNRVGLHGDQGEFKSLDDREPDTK